MKKRDIVVQVFDQLVRDISKAPAARGLRGHAGRRVNPGIEKYQQHDGCKLLSQIGSAVYTIGTRRSRGKPCPKCHTFVPEDQGTRQTEGIPDVLAFLPARNGAARVLLFWEAKHADGGRASAEQLAFAALCREAAQAHVLGPFDVLYAWLIEHGYLRADRVPHYRLPKGVTT